MRQLSLSLRRGALIGLFAVAASGCATHQPPPSLTISAGETTYVKVIPAPQVVSISMPSIVIAGTAGEVVNQNTQNRSAALYDALRNDPRTLALQTRFQDRVIQEGKARGLMLKNGDAVTEGSDQVIYLRGFHISYLAKTVAHSYSPVAMAFIESSRDPAIQPGKTRVARVATAQVDDRSHSFATAAGVVENRAASLDGMEMAVDALAIKVAADLYAARQP